MRSHRFIIRMATATLRSSSSNRYTSTSAAKSLLGFDKHSKPTVKELRYAYFEAAKKCHPDVQAAADGMDFRYVTEAYEHLLNSGHTQDTNVDISLEEEKQYRRACQDFLGIPADIVEESKQNPMFRHWLGGNTDGAQHWRSFFSVHGGLAQKLRPPAGYLESATTIDQPKSETRRRRKR